MKQKTLFIALLCAAVLATGCNKEQTASEQLEQAKTDTKAAAEDMKSYTFAQKGEFAAKMQAQLDALNKDFEQISAKIESSSDAVKAKAKPELQGLRDQVVQMNKQLENVRNATESTWESVKATSQKSFDSLKNGFQKSRQWASDKIAP